MSRELSYTYLKSLKKNSVAWSLLRTRELPISFLHLSFIAKNRRSIPYEDLKAELSDYLYVLQQRYGEESRDSAEYHLRRWSQPTHPFLSVRYNKKNTEVLDLTPGAEKALRWLEGLEEKEFVGTESRLKNIFSQLEELVDGIETDNAKIIGKLEQKKRDIQRQIEQVKAGRIERPSPRRIREQFAHIEEEARDLLSDFRQIEENFRGLDRAFRKKISVMDISKGQVLDGLFGDHDAIYESDQGKSFRAFWEFLMQEERSEEIHQGLGRILALNEVAREKRNSILGNFVHHLLESAEKVNSVNNQLTSQLRRFLNDKTILENKRMMKIIQGIEGSLLACSGSLDDDKVVVSQVPLLCPSLNLELSKGIQVPSEQHTISFIEEEKEDSEEGRGTLFEIHYVDEEELLARIDYFLSRQERVNIEEIVDVYPITKGLAEMACYYNIAEKRRAAKIYKEHLVELVIRAMDLPDRKLECPNIVFGKVQ